MKIRCFDFSNFVSRLCFTLILRAQANRSAIIREEVPGSWYKCNGLCSNVMSFKTSWILVCFSPDSSSEATEQLVCLEITAFPHNMQSIFILPVLTISENRKPAMVCAAPNTSDS